MTSRRKLKSLGTRLVMHMQNLYRKPVFWILNNLYRHISAPHIDAQFYQWEQNENPAK